MVTRSDLRPGCQIAQTSHGVAQFMLENQDLAKQWNNQYLISLAVKSEQKLQTLLLKVLDTGAPVSYFTEPDYDDQLTVICFPETEETKALTAKIPLSLCNQSET